MCELPRGGGTFVPSLGSPRQQFTGHPQDPRSARRTGGWAHAACGGAKDPPLGTTRRAQPVWRFEGWKSSVYTVGAHRLSVQVPSSVLARELGCWALASHACSQPLTWAACTPGPPVATPISVTPPAPHTGALSPPLSSLRPAGPVPPGWLRPCEAALPPPCPSVTIGAGTGPAGPPGGPPALLPSPQGRVWPLPGHPGAQGPHRPHVLTASSAQWF